MEGTTFAADPMRLMIATAGKISRKRKCRKIPKVHKRYREEKIMQLKSQKMRKLAPELDPLRIGTGWTKEDLGKVQVIVESTYGDSHPGREQTESITAWPAVK